MRITPIQVSAATAFCDTDPHRNHSARRLQTVVAMLRDRFLHTGRHPDTHRQALDAELIVRNNAMLRIRHILDNGLRGVQFRPADRLESRRCGKLNSISRSPCLDSHRCESFRMFQIKIGACILTLCGNVVVYLTILGYFLFLDPDDNATYGGMA